MTEAEYLAAERPSEVRHLYLDGKVSPVPSESPNHNYIVGNVVAVAGKQLKKTAYFARFIGTRVRSGTGKRARTNAHVMYSYPDVLVFRGRGEYHDAHRDSLLNPIVILEVLSPSTESFDRGGKFERYREFNPTLTDYVLVAQAKPLVEHFQRQPDDTWLCRYHAGLRAKVVVASVGVTLRLRDIYDRVAFDAG